MGKIVYIMGKSCTGKDTIYKRLLQNNELALNKKIPYTTRPIRQKEIDGVEYHFVTEEKYQELKNTNVIIEERSYDTFHGLWRYFTVDDEDMRNDTGNFIMIGTLEAYGSIKRYFGDENVIPVLIELDDGDRLQRALNREKKQKVPKYEELCRRFLADSRDFSHEKIEQAGITKTFYNADLEKCLGEIEEYIKSGL